MYLQRILRINRFKNIGHIRCLHDGKSKNEDDKPYTLEPEDPITRTARILKGDIVQPWNKIKKLFTPPKILTEQDIRDIRIKRNNDEFQSHCDILIIGGGGVGSSIAYWLMRRSSGGLNVVVLEKDPSVSKFHWYMFCIILLVFNISSNQPQQHCQ